MGVGGGADNDGDKGDGACRGAVISQIRSTGGKERSRDGSIIPELPACPGADKLKAVVSGMTRMFVAVGGGRSGVPGAKVINGDGLRGVGRGAASSHRHQVMEKVRVSTAGDDVRQGLIGRGGTGEEDLLTAHSERLVGSLWLMEL
ncbi:hypothetical protein TYRP_014152 [Tyrophagus putrescentiae]|nr:hypothetical protein TYRP_014152 [Tyrophagus putrescentiae]